MTKRSYNQYCAIAAALDVLGERWTLLIVRNLLLGPQRFSDLLNELPGIGTGLLTERLKHLERTGVIARTTLPPPAASTVYQLTPTGDDLRPILIGLGRWGMAQLGDPDDRYIAPDLLALGLQARFDPTRASGADGTYELRIDDRAYRVDIDQADITVRATSTENPRATIATDTATLVDLNTGTRTLADALAHESLTIAGDPTALPALAGAFALADPAAT
ncbi:helix-turn-helix domain-containing protein [Nocardia sp. BMG51109]|uniref:winged helix-turn-helix transcriptional regulator n=1 Tax=Nocardia sp. BMG51109 TaxID=1056816 RepID=UPI000465770C|nr:winged helix-turn-helix transcriptional regulator [Nocardia sp. BMG51109]